jgi:formylglycine-generating enzyme required for sulfatase activity
MLPAPADILSLELQAPSRWVHGESRLIKLRLRNGGAVDLKQLRLRTTWWGTEPTEEPWKTIPILRRGAVIEELLKVQPPAGREDHFQIELRVNAGPHLHLELCSEQKAVLARPRPGAEGAVHVVFENSGISGDKIGFGQVASDGGAMVGHQVHLHGNNATAEFERWLAEDPWAAQLQPLPLHIAQEKCQPWTNPHDMELVGIMRGEFIMGASTHDVDAVPEEKCHREISLTRSFWMAAHPVTNAQWTAVMKTPTPVTLKGHQADHMPVANVTWGQAVDFCAQLTALEQATGALPPGYAYRLPSEAEWEYACRAGCKDLRYGALSKVGSVLANGGRMVEVGRFEPNAWGLYDMLGLVFEWCLDGHAPYNRQELVDPVNWPQHGPRIIRGGCYQGPDFFARASARLQREPQCPSHRIGFRVVLARE